VAMRRDSGGGGGGGGAVTRPREQLTARGIVGTAMYMAPEGASAALAHSGALLHASRSSVVTCSVSVPVYRWAV
jgi:hypothetical protein